MKIVDDQFDRLDTFPQRESLTPGYTQMTHRECSLATIQRSVLVIEDQKGYLELICEAIHEVFPEIRLQTARDGEQAWQLLNRPQQSITGFWEDEIPEIQIYPSLIISDLNLPKFSGLELLDLIKQDPYLRAIPVVIFSTSKDEDDILRCYEAQANCYITKPNNIEEFFEVVQDIVHFWLNLVTPPPLLCRVD